VGSLRVWQDWLPRPEGCADRLGPEGALPAGGDAKNSLAGKSARTPDLRGLLSLWKKRPGPEAFPARKRGEGDTLAIPQMPGAAATGWARTGV
jgi:hypothetical protein